MHSTETTIAIPITGDEEADALLTRSPLALLLGMLLDQQVPMEWAFRGPMLLEKRMGAQLSAVSIAAMTPEAVTELFQVRPALHRYPRAMAARAHALCKHLSEQYDGDVARIWTIAPEVKHGSKAAAADAVLARLLALPGFGDEKAKIFLAILGKRMGIRPRGWKAACAPFSDAVPRSVADVGSKAALVRVRAFKQEMRAAGLTKQDARPKRRGRT